VVVSYDRSEGATEGTLTMHVDGGKAIEPLATSPTAVDQEQPFQLVGGGEIASVTLWDVALDVEDLAPMWGPPEPGTPGLIAAFDFANGPASDVSGNDYPVTFGQQDTQAWVQPCLDLDGTGWAVAQFPGGPTEAGAPFTIMGWTRVEALPDESVQAFDRLRRAFPVFLPGPQPGLELSVGHRDASLELGPDVGPVGVGELREEPVVGLGHLALEHRVDALGEWEGDVPAVRKERRGRLNAPAHALLGVVEPGDSDCELLE
jgi:hypothetical protein